MILPGSVPRFNERVAKDTMMGNPIPIEASPDSKAQRSSEIHVVARQRLFTSADSVGAHFPVGWASRQHPNQADCTGSKGFLPRS
jgi:hypothetical protein